MEQNEKLTDEENESLETEKNEEIEEFNDEVKEEDQFSFKDLQDQIMEYLKKQEEPLEEEDEREEEAQMGEFLMLMEEEYPEKTHSVVLEFLDDMMTNIGEITTFKKAYDKLKTENNQYELFDLTKIVKNFHINDKVMESMSFRETLIVSKVDEKGKTEAVGGLCLDIHTALGAKWEKSRKCPDFTKNLLEICNDFKRKQIAKDEIEHKFSQDIEEFVEFLREESKKEYKKFVVHLSSEFSHDGRDAGSRITSWVDRNLHTLEEKRSEHIDYGDTNKTNNSKDNNNATSLVSLKQLCVFMGKEHYIVHAYPGADYSRKHCYHFESSKDYVSEAANFLLMRYLAIVKFIGEFELSALHIDGGLCRNLYSCEGPMGGFINNEKMDLYKVYRTIIEECGITHRSCTILDMDGHIMKHDWDDCVYVLQLNPMLSSTRKKSSLVLQINEKWKHDMQMLSKYLDKKITSTFQTKSYINDHREICNLISDYVQNILQIKPDNIIEFTKHFFLSYAPYLLPRVEYFEKELYGCINNDD